MSRAKREGELDVDCPYSSVAMVTKSLQQNKRFSFNRSKEFQCPILYQFIFCFHGVVAMYNYLHSTCYKTMIRCSKHALEGRQNWLVRNLFLNEHPNGTKHGKTTVLKFLGRHFTKSLSVSRLQAKRIKSNVARVVVID